MIPLLDDPRVNPHATLVALFTNLHEVNTTKEERLEAHDRATLRALKYLPSAVKYPDPTAVDFMRFLVAMHCLTEAEPVFDRYVRFSRPISS